MGAALGVVVFVTFYLATWVLTLIIENGPIPINPALTFFKAFLEWADVVAGMGAWVAYTLVDWIDTVRDWSKQGTSGGLDL